MKIVLFKIVMTVHLKVKKKSKKIKMLTGQILMERKVQWMQTETRSKRRKEDFLNADHLQSLSLQASQLKMLWRMTSSPI